MAWHSDVAWQPTGFEVAESDSATTVTEAGTEDSFTVALTAPPPSQVVLTITTSDTSEAEVDPPQLTFTSENWNQPQTVRVIGVDDLIVDGDQSAALAIAVDVGNSHDAFDNLPDQTVIVTTTDDDIAGYAVEETQGATVVTESGDIDSFTVVLTSQPLSNVVLAVNAENSSKVTLDRALLTFTPQNWSQPQAVIVGGIRDELDDGDQEVPVTLSIVPTLSHDAFANLPDRMIVVTISEGNQAPTLAAIGNKHVEEGNLLTFTASASDPDTPANTLTFSLDPGAPPGASIDPQTGVFTWVPTEAEGPGAFNITVRVTDDGTPNLDDFETFSVQVGDDSPWQNFIEPHAVNTDGFVSPLDALIVINDLNRNGARRLLAPNQAFAPPPYLDVNGDGFVAPGDVLRIINKLNESVLVGEGEIQVSRDPPTVSDPRVAGTFVQHIGPRLDPITQLSRGRVARIRMDTDGEFRKIAVPRLAEQASGRREVDKARNLEIERRNSKFESILDEIVEDVTKTTLSDLWPVA